MNITYCYESDEGQGTFEVTGTVSKYYPARISGPPEHCSPAEGGEVEIEGVEMVEGTEEIKRLFLLELDREGRVREEVEDKLFDAAQGAYWGDC